MTAVVVVPAPPFAPTRVMIGLSGGPKSNWVHAEDVARATVHLTRHGEDCQAYNVCDDDPIPFGDIIPVASEAYGLPSKFNIPYPLGVMTEIGPVLERAGGAFGKVNGVLAAGWEKICAKYSLERELVPKVDPEAMAYAYRHTTERVKFQRDRPGSDLKRGEG